MNKTNYLILDQLHVRKLKDPANMGNKRFFVPEGYSDNPKAEYQRYKSASARMVRHDILKESDPMRCSFA